MSPEEETSPLSVEKNPTGFFRPFSGVLLCNGHGKPRSFYVLALPDQNASTLYVLCQDCLFLQSWVIYLVYFALESCQLSSI